MQLKALYYLTNLIALFLFSTFVYSQPAVEWSKCYGSGSTEYFAGMVEAHAGGFVIAGTADSCKYGNGDFWIVKIDDTGKTLWTKCYGGSQAELANTIIKVQGEITSNDGYLLAGRTHSTDGDITTSHGAFDFWLVKIDVNGALQWQKTYGGSGGEEATGATQTKDGGIVITGYTFSNDGDVTGLHGGHDWWVLKVDQSGSIVWKKTLGGSLDEEFPHVTSTSDGGVAIAGLATSSDGDVSNAFGGKDIWVVKLDASGNKQWDKSYGSWANDHAVFICQTVDSGYIVSGVTANFPSAGLYHGLIKLDDTGAVQWSAPPVTWGLIEMGNKEYITIGITVTANADGLIRRIDSVGTPIWSKQIGGSGNDLLRAVQRTSDGGYIAAGGTTSNDGDVNGNYGMMDYWIVKFAPDPLSAKPVRNNYSPIGVYPNPATTVIHFTKKVNSRLINVLGKECMSAHQTEFLDISRVPPGIYIVILYDEKRQILKRETVVKN